MNIEMDKSWKEKLQGEFLKDYYIELMDFLDSEEEAKKEIYPPREEIFSAFNLTPFDKVKVIIIGQDPYHGPGQAHGLSFSVKAGVKIPPSLVNIYKELYSDIGMEIPNHGYLGNWASQGVLMLNSVLTVERGKAGSHQKKGWEIFTDQVIDILNNDKENLVFILWGKPAQKKGARIDRKKHLVLESVHPSPLSAYRGFFGGKYFSKTNSYLISKNIKKINWNI